MKKLIMLSLLVSLSLLGAHQSYAGDSNFGGVRIDSNSDGSTTSSTKVFKVFNTSGTEVYSITAAGAITASGAESAASFTATGDVTFRSTLLANGRAGGASTLGSSSTQLSPSTLPYSVILKKVGGGGGLDSNGVGTTLPNGTNGQELSLVITGLQSGGSWVITPTTCTGYTRITLDTVGDSVRLLYVDSTTGWVITSASGVIIAGTGTE